MEIKQYATIIWRWAWLILLATFLAACAAYIASGMQTPVYQATTSILIDQAPDARTADITSLMLSEQLTSTYAQLMTKRPVLEEVLEQLDVGMGPNSLRGAIQVLPTVDTQIIEIKVQHTDPVAAADIANTLVQVFSEQNEELQASRYAASKENLTTQLTKLEEQISQTEKSIVKMGSPRTDSGIAELERLQGELSQYQASYTALLQSYENLRLAEARSVSNIVQIEPAIVPSSPISPRIVMNTFLAGIVGAVLAVGVIFLIEYLDDTVKSTEEATETLGIPVIGFVAKSSADTDGVPMTAREPRAPIAEAFRSLRSNIQFSGVDDPIKTLLVTSPGPEEGKSTISANLAVIMAHEGKRVLLVDADLRRPRVHKMMGVSNNQGLTDFFLRSHTELNGIIRSWEYDNLYLLTSGKHAPNPAELLGSTRMTQVLNMLRGKYDFVIIDTPPIGAVTDPVILSAKTDAVLLVVEPKKTRMAAAVQAVEQLKRAGANLIGMVYNNVPLKRASYYTGYYSGYYYQYAYAYTKGENGKEPTRVKRKVRKKRVKA
jgi:capsular exopolysaccharide synthesis family protein